MNGEPHVDVVQSPQIKVGEFRKRCRREIEIPNRTTLATILHRYSDRRSGVCDKELLSTDWVEIRIRSCSRKCVEEKSGDGHDLIGRLCDRSACSETDREDCASDMAKSATDKGRIAARTCSLTDVADVEIESRSSEA